MAIVERAQEKEWFGNSSYPMSHENHDKKLVTYTNGSDLLYVDKNWRNDVGKPEYTDSS